MSIEAKHAYRFVFLKSEKWQNFRLEELVKEDGECCICRHSDSSNDIHHVTYPERWDETRSKHVVVLCRKCHERVHLLTDGIKFESNGQKWKHFKLVVEMFKEYCKETKLAHSQLEKERKGAQKEKSSREAKMRCFGCNQKGGVGNECRTLTNPLTGSEWSPGLCSTCHMEAIGFIENNNHLMITTSRFFMLTKRFLRRKKIQLTQEVPASSVEADLQVTV